MRNRVGAGPLIFSLWVRLLAVVVSFLLAAGFEAAGSFVCLIPTQSLHGNERFVLVWLGVSIAFVIVNAVGAGIGLFPIGIVYGAEVWERTVLGFMAGSVLAALCISVELEAIPQAYVNVLAPFRLGMLVIGALSPPAGGLTAFIVFRPKQNSTGTVAPPSP
jgi:hypothetical protein